MKKVILFVVLTTTLAGTIVSCGKSTKGKMDGEWNVDTYTESTTSTSGSNTSSSTMAIEGTTVTYSNTSGGNTYTQTGTVDVANWNIKKDGTWDRELTLTFVSGGLTTKQISKSSGNWAFQSKIGEYKKNERVVFSVLSETNTETNTSGGVSITDTETTTYLDGESTEIYVITESKKKELMMESKKSSTYTSGSTSTETSEGTIKMSLKD